MFKSILAPWIALMLFVLSAGLAAAQEPPLPKDPPVEGDDDADAVPPDIPVGPETTVIGRVGAFEGTVLTPTRTEVFAGEVGSSLSVITGEQIANSQQTQVTEVLRTVPGLSVVQSGPPGSMTSIFIRGANSSHTKVMIDGIAVNDPSNANRMFNFSHLSVDNIQQIEILRGPQSMLYGSDAIGGVINIITKRVEGPMSIRAKLMGGSYGTSHEAINVSGGDDLLNYSFGGSYLQSDGFSTVVGTTEQDGLRQGNFSGRFGWTPSDSFDVDYIFRYVDSDAEIDDWGIDNPDRENRTEAFFNRLQLRKVLLDGFWEQKVGFNFIHYDRLDTDPGFFGIPRFQGSSRIVDYQSNFRFSDDHTLSVGVDYLDENAASTVLARTSQDNAGIYVQDQFQLADQWFTTVGFRWDDHSSAGTAQTYRVTTLYRIPWTGTAFHGSIGTGFRAPSLADKFGFAGNPSLRPERSKGWDCGLEQMLFCDRLVIDGTYFRNDFNNLIQWVGPFPGSMENVGRAFSSGVELTAAWQVNPCTTLRANYVHTFTEDLSTGMPLGRRPAHTASLTLESNHDRVKLLASLLYVGPRLNSSFGSDYLDEYYLLNLAGTYDLNDHRQLFVRVDNVLDETYEEALGFSAAGISCYAGMNFLW